MQCPYFREILTSISLIFYHIYAPFLVAVGAETWLGHKMLTHGQLLTYYPDLKRDLEGLTSDPGLLFSKNRLPHLKDFEQLTKIGKKVYQDMADSIFVDLDSLISSGDINTTTMECIIKLICEDLLIVIHRQVDEFYGATLPVTKKKEKRKLNVQQSKPMKYNHRNLIVLSKSFSVAETACDIC